MHPAVLCQSCIPFTLDANPVRPLLLHGMPHLHVCTCIHVLSSSSLPCLTGQPLESAVFPRVAGQCCLVQLPRPGPRSQGVRRHCGGSPGTWQVCVVSASAVYCIVSCVSCIVLCVHSGVVVLSLCGTSPNLPPLPIQVLPFGPHVLLCLLPLLARCAVD